MPTNFRKRFGVLASISWNSNDWSGEPLTADLKASKYDYVKDKGHMHESLNFGQNKYPVGKDGFYIGYTPMFNRPPSPKNSKDERIVFFLSSDYRNANRKAIVGFYAFPEFGRWFSRTAKHRLYNSYDSGNIKARVENIVYLKNPVIIDNIRVQTDNLLPKGKKISKQGFNYLNSDNV